MKRETKEWDKTLNIDPKRHIFFFGKMAYLSQAIPGRAEVYAIFKLLFMFVIFSR